MSTPKVGGQNTGRPLHFKSRGQYVPLSTHGYTPMLAVAKDVYVDVVVAAAAAAVVKFFD